MYTLDNNNNIACSEAIKVYVDKYSHEDFIVTDYILDISYFNTFNTDVINTVLEFDDNGFILEDIFLNVVLSTILNNDTNEDIDKLTKESLILLEEVMSTSGIEIDVSDNLEIHNRLLLHIDTLRNNVNASLDRIKLLDVKRIVNLDVFAITNVSEFYVIDNFTNMGYNKNISNKSLYIKLYRKVKT